MTDERTEILSAFDVGAINIARSALDALVRENRPPETGLEGWRRDSYMRDYGHLQGLAEEASSLLFTLLNYGKHHLEIDISDADLHMHDPVAEEANAEN